MPKIPDDIRNSTDSRWIVCYPWDSTPDGPRPNDDLVWNTADYTWDDVCVVQALLGGGEDVNAYNKLSEKDKKIFIELMFKIKRQTESDKYFKMREFQTQKLEVKDIKVTTDDVKLVIEEFKSKMSIFLISSPDK